MGKKFYFLFSFLEKLTFFFITWKWIVNGEIFSLFFYFIYRGASEIDIYDRSIVYKKQPISFKDARNFSIVLNFRRKDILFPSLYFSLLSFHLISRSTTRKWIEKLFWKRFFFSTKDILWPEVIFLTNYYFFNNFFLKITKLQF